MRSYDSWQNRLEIGGLGFPGRCNLPLFQCSDGRCRHEPFLGVGESAAGAGGVFAYEALAVRWDRYYGDTEEVFLAGQVTGHLFVLGDGLAAVGAIVVVEQEQPCALFQLVGAPIRSGKRPSW